MIITLIRHTSVAICPGICYGNSDVDVSPLFEKEAQQVLSSLQHIPFDAVYSSPLSRCRKLACYCGFTEPIIDGRLMELNFGDWEMKAWSEIEDPQLQHWFDNWIDEPPTNGESFTTMIHRVEEFLFELKKLPFKHVAIFTHAGVIRSVGIITKRFNALKSFDFKVDYGESIDFILQ